LWITPPQEEAAVDNIFLPNQRIIVLQGLEKDPGRSMSNALLQRLLRTYGHNCGIAEVNRQINWLEQRGYVTTDRLADSGLVIVEILRPGIEVATGLVRAEGIDPPLQED
jgi:Fe2+ or Zn2+ uptake regulation protein